MSSLFDVNTTKVTTTTSPDRSLSHPKIEKERKSIASTLDALTHFQPSKGVMYCARDTGLTS